MPDTHPPSSTASDEIQETAHLQQTTVQHLVAQEATLEECAIGKMSAGDVQCHKTAVGLLRARSATLNASNVSALAARQVFSDEGVTASFIAARQVEAPRVETKILLAQHVQGNVTTLLDTPTALLAGAAAGAVLGILAWLLRRR